MSNLSEGAVVVGGVLGLVALIVAMLSIVPLILMLAWNFVMPKFGLPEIGFWESFAMTVVMNILLGGLRRVKAE